MHYKQILQKQIQELEEKIASASTEKEELKRQLQKLKLAEFEEDIKDTDNRQLLKG